MNENDNELTSREGDDEEEENEINEETIKDELEFIEKIKQEKYDEIKTLLSESKTPIKIWKYNTKENDGSSVLHLSVLLNCSKIIKKIIKYCKKNLSENKFKNFINKKNNKGLSAIHYAAFKGNIEIFHILILNGADINSLTDKSLNVLHFACQGNKPNILVYMDYFYKNKIGINKTDAKNSTPLHWACFSSSYECVNFLLDKDAEMNNKDKDENTPLHLAVQSASSRIVRLLLQKGANASIKNNKGETPMEFAYNKKRIEIYEILKINNKCAICNFRAPAKKIDKSKKYIFVGIFFKILTYFILFCNIFPFLYNKTCYEYCNILSILLYLIINIILIILYFYLICSNPGYIKNNEKITDFENLLLVKKEDFKNFCFKCSVYKTGTLKHCIVCDKCCYEFDHHCFWINKCVGKNNYISFIILLYICFIDFISMILISSYSLFVSFEIFLKIESTCNNSNEIINTIYKNIKEYISYIEVDYDFIPKNPYFEYLKVSIIFLLSINIIFIFPLIYLINIHTKNCKKKKKGKIYNQQIDFKIENINPDQLLGPNSDSSFDE